MHGAQEKSDSHRPHTPELFVDALEQHRIPVGPEFADMYSDFDNDMRRVENASSQFESRSIHSKEVELGKIAEGLIFTLLAEGKISEHFQFRAAHLYDDYFHGVDAIVEPKRGAVPALATIDITINQEDIKGRTYRGTDFEETRPVGLENKLMRAKRYIDYLARLDPKVARELLGWIQSGGLHEKRSRQNEILFREAEKIMLLKYYKTPKNAQEPEKPGHVIGGPLAVISIDTVFVNRALQGNKRAQEMIEALSLVEFALGILIEHEYLKGLTKRNPNKNVLFDTHYTKVDAWARILNQESILGLVSSLLKEFRRDTDFNDQLSYYRNTITRIFK